MQCMKVVGAFSDRDAARAYVNRTGGLVLTATSGETAHLPFAALTLQVSDDLVGLREAADVGTYLVCERTMKNQPLAALPVADHPGSVGIFTMVANPEMGKAAADAHWRDIHTPIALDVHQAMTHYYQLSVQHVFDGPDWNGFALCCFASEDDLRHRFFATKEGEERVNQDVRTFADTRQSPRRVIAEVVS